MQNATSRSETIAFPNLLWSEPTEWIGRRKADKSHSANATRHTGLLGGLFPAHRGRRIKADLNKKVVEAQSQALSARSWYNQAFSRHKGLSRSRSWYFRANSGKCYPNQPIAEIEMNGFVRKYIRGRKISDNRPSILTHDCIPQTVRTAKLSGSNNWRCNWLFSTRALLALTNPGRVGSNWTVRRSIADREATLNNALRNARRRSP